MWRRMPVALLAALVLVLALALPSHAGDIPGMPSMLPPHLAPRFDLVFSNDALGRGGEVDDFRTQQLAFSAALDERWSAVLDHSMLTLSEPGAEGRLDQLSASLGYRFLDRRTGGTVSRLSGGLGLRTVGNYRGERMQNGFHRLIDSELKDLPYRPEDGTDATAWLDAEHLAPFASPGAWRLAWWVRARALATSDGQFDATAGAFAVAGRGGFDLWTGLRQDWRSGYEEPVQRATADAEEDLAFVLGLRFGGLVLETVQQFHEEASYGQLRLLSLESAAHRVAARPPRLGLETGFLLPDVHVHLAGRYASTFAIDESSAWRESVFVSADLGEPQYGDDPALYRQSVQLGIGLEWEHPVYASGDWLAGYVSVGAGWRRERLIGEGALAGRESDSADRPVLLGGAGLRFMAGSMGRRWTYRIQAGISAWLPGGRDDVELDGQEYGLLDPGLALSLGVTFDFG